MSYDDRKEGFRAGMLKAMTLARISMPTEDFDRDVKEYMARFPREPNPARVSIGDLAHWYGQGSECRRNGGSSPYAGNTIAHAMHAWGWLAQDLRMALDATKAKWPVPPSPEKDGDELRPNGFIRGAFATLGAAMRTDPGYAWSWHCNIAMPIMDSIDVSHEKANRAAKSVMALIFGIDVTEFDEWKLLEKQWADHKSEDVRKRADWDGSFAHNLDVESDMIEADQRDQVFQRAEKSSDLYADMAAEMVKGLKAAGMREQHRERNRERSGMVDAMNAPYGKQSERTVADVIRERGIEALFSSADYTTRMNAERFREGLIKFMPSAMTPWSQLMHDAVVLLLERVK